MDIPKKSRSGFATKKRLLLVTSLVFISFYGWSYLAQDPSSEKVERSDLIIAEVKEGELLRDVRAPGTLQPTKLRWIAASSSSRVEQILIHPGAKVTADTVIMQLSNPALSRDVDVATNALQVAKAQQLALEKRLQSNLLTQEAVVAEVDALYQNAVFRLEADQALSRMGVVPGLDAKENKLIHKQLEIRLGIEQKRMTNLQELLTAELSASQAEISQAQSQLNLQQELLDDLQVKAGLSGILQLVPVEQGQQVDAGVVIARVAQEDSLKSELRVQESQVKNVRIGQSVMISAGGQSAKGYVHRIEPAVQNGVVIVDVYFDGDSLNGARPDLRVDGLIEIERLQNVLTLQRPVYSQENQLTQLYVIDDNDQAKLTQVSLGSASLGTIQVLEGVSVGDRVVVSDTSQFNQQPLLAIE